MDTFVLQLLNGLVAGMLLFIMAAGLSLIFGLMNVVNLTHGAYYLLGSYVGLSVLRATDNFWLALLIAPLIVGGVGVLVERFLLRRMYGGHRHLEQVLLTFGLAIIASDLMQWGFGAYVESVPVPPALSGSVPLFGLSFPTYRLAIIVIGLVLAAVLWFMSYIQKSEVANPAPAV